MVHFLNFMQGGAQMEERRGLDSFTLKLMMAALMVLDHLYYFLPDMGFPIWFTMAGRVVAPTFCYLMTQSLYYTRDRSRYIRRLTFAGLAMLAGNILLMLLAASLRNGTIIPLDNSIFLSLAVSAVVVDRLERLKESFHFRHVVLILVMLLTSLLLEGAFLLPVMAVIFYFLRNRKVLMSIAYLVGSTLSVYLLMGLSGSSTRYTFELFGYRLHTQYLQAFALIPIFLYNKKPGPRTWFSKWFFYLFYPLHIWVLYLVSVVT